jgi:hypothetical protein
MIDRQIESVSRAVTAIAERALHPLKLAAIMTVSA